MGRPARAGGKEAVMNFLSAILALSLVSLDTSCDLKSGSSSDNETAALSYDKISAAVASAKAGDTVSLPAGRATWSKALVITKGVKLVGAGSGQTIIKSGISLSSSGSIFSSSNYLIVFKPSSPSADTVFRVSGMTLNLQENSYGIMLQNTSTTAVSSIRIDDNIIENAYGEGNGLLIHVYGTLYGVVDDNVFTSGSVRCNALDATTWEDLTFDFGTADNMYFEDNKFASPDTMFFYGEMGGRYCVRYNTFDGTGSSNGLYPCFDMHGNQPNAHLATMGAEIYGNTISCNKGICLLDQRGGKALVFGNILDTSSTAVSKVREEYNDSVNPPADDAISGQPQHVSGSYYWNNLTGTGSLVSVYINGTVDYGGTIGLVPQENVDFWQQGTSFDGTTGVGLGLLAARPTTCTKGVAYWATDETALYIATANDVWTMYYVPYTYPHPLRSSLN